MINYFNKTSTGTKIAIGLTSIFICLIIFGIAYLIYKYFFLTSQPPAADAALSTEPLNYINGRYVKLSLTTKGILNIAEVKIYTNDGLNIALDPQTIITQSSILNNNLFNPSYINDDNYDTGFHSNDENNPWIKFDLGSEKSITEIIVIPRLDCCQSRSKGLVVTISDSTDTQIIYTGDKITDINGDTKYDNIVGDMYNIYTYTMPSTKAIGSNF